MTRAAIITSGVVTNVITVDQANVPNGAVYPPDGTAFEIGWSYSPGNNGAVGTFTAPAAPAATTAQLMVYAASKQQSVSSNGLTVGGVFVGTDTQGLTLLNGAVALAGQVPSQAFSWSIPTGSVSLTASQVIAIGVAVATFVQHTFTALQAVQSAITAGTITTTAQIDAYAWPTS
jgi:hypothetical protein